MKLALITKLDKGNTEMAKKISDEVISVNFDVIVISPIYGKFGAIRKPDSGRMISKTYIFINSITFCLTRTENTTKNF